MFNSKEYKKKWYQKNCELSKERTKQWRKNNPEHIGFKCCWKLDNLRLLPAKENLIKNNYLIQPFQLILRI